MWVVYLPFVVSLMLWCGAGMFFERWWLGCVVILLACDGAVFGIRVDLWLF